MLTRSHLWKDLFWLKVLEPEIPPWWAAGLVTGAGNWELTSSAVSMRQKEWAGSGIRLLISEPAPRDSTSSRKAIPSKHSQTVPQLGNQGFESWDSRGQFLFNLPHHPRYPTQSLGDTSGSDQSHSWPEKAGVSRIWVLEDLKCMSQRNMCLGRFWGRRWHQAWLVDDWGLEGQLENGPRMQTSVEVELRDWVVWFRDAW